MHFTVHLIMLKNHDVCNMILSRGVQYTLFFIFFLVIVSDTCAQKFIPMSLFLKHE